MSGEECNHTILMSGDDYDKVIAAAESRGIAKGHGFAALAVKSLQKESTSQGIRGTLEDHANVVLELAINTILSAAAPQPAISERLTVERYIEDMESLRQGFRDVLDFVPLTPVQRFSFGAHHQFANKRVVELGGEDVQLPKKAAAPQEIAGEGCVWDVDASYEYLRKYLPRCNHHKSCLMPKGLDKICPYCGKPIVIGGGR